LAERSHVGLRLGLGLGSGLGLEIWLGLGLVLGLALGLPRDFFQPITIRSANPQFLIGLIMTLLQQKLFMDYVQTSK